MARLITLCLRATELIFTSMLTKLEILNWFVPIATSLLLWRKVGLDGLRDYFKALRVCRRWRRRRVALRRKSSNYEAGLNCSALNCPLRARGKSPRFRK